MSDPSLPSVPEQPPVTPPSELPPDSAPGPEIPPPLPDVEPLGPPAELPPMGPDPMSTPPPLRA